MNPSPELTRLAKAILASVTVSWLVVVPVAPPTSAQFAPSTSGATVVPKAVKGLPPPAQTSASSGAVALKPSSPATPSTATGSTQPQPPTTLLQDIETLWRKYRLPLIVVGATLIGYLGVLWAKPLWLLRLPSSDIPVPWTTWKVPLGLVRTLKYRDRVLDAWVEQNWQAVQAAFLKLDNVKAREIHISLPVHLNKIKPFIDDLKGSHLVSIFKQKPAVLLITGEGGAGKTSLACQIAQWGLKKELCSHRMLPVLIETELDNQRTLVAAIRGQLTALCNQAEPILPELLEKLLQRQRILVIVDHLSEMSEATRKQITPELADFLAKALVVTSRLEESLGGVPKTVLEPLRIEADRLLKFLYAYLNLRQKDNAFLDEEYSAACDRLRRMVGQRNITVLLARLYADQMIEQQEGAGGTLPNSVPELMLSYLNQLNRAIEPANQRDNLQVQEDAQRVAWECLKQTYRPAAATKAAVLAALEAQGIPKDEVKARLEYLEKRLQLLKTLEPGDKMRVILDPLAEYLAAICLVNDFIHQENPEEAWQKFVKSIDEKLKETNDPPEAIQGFLSAVLDYCKGKQKEARILDEELEALTRKSGQDPEELRRLEEQRRIRLLISDLSAPEEEYRIEACEKLSKMASAASKAAPNLIGMLQNPNQTSKARQAAAQALGKLGIGEEPLIAVLNSPNEEQAIRRSAAEALGLMKAGKTQLRCILESDQQPLAVRQGAARALSLIGAPSGEKVPMLIGTLQEDQVIAQVQRISVFRETLDEELTLDLVEVPGGTFQMGSPPDEMYRDWYGSYYPECEGLDGEAQHPVQVQPFLMSQYPITQAQWRAVAALPPVERERRLNPDPSNFKGDSRPVEVVSWYEAIEFCARLSQHTGKRYRLPSEAEWEYACRAGTTTPFHFGPTLSADWANYDGNYSYGAGVNGKYRQKTTQVGSFGVVNTYGLADMHGNVWEWCLDPWHPSYEEAPSDGSAWQSNGDERYRLLRGGSWGNGPGYCRSASRVRDAPGNQSNYLGFRVVCGSPWTD
jgi:formylglycine-generating enzyme required for sulfatase activity